MTDIFLTKQNFETEPWYDDFLIFCNIGCCRPKEEHREAVQKALGEYGYETKVSVNPRDKKTYIVGI
jgi:N-acetyl-anhydromuramyl-L-alanine amidase AmpD